MTNRAESQSKEDAVAAHAETSVALPAVTLVCVAHAFLFAGGHRSAETDIEFCWQAPYAHRKQLLFIKMIFETVWLANCSFPHLDPQSFGDKP
jgi:hypothetical protein